MLRLILEIILHDEFIRKRRQCAPSEDSVQLAHSRNLIRIFTGCILDSQGYTVSPYDEWRLWSDGGDTHADLSLRWAHRSAGMLVLKYFWVIASTKYLSELYQQSILHLIQRKINRYNDCLRRSYLFHETYKKRWLFNNVNWNNRTQGENNPSDPADRDQFLCKVTAHNKPVSSGSTLFAKSVLICDYHPP